MAFLRNLGKAVKIGVTAYITSGIAYWITAEVYIRYIGKEVTFTPLLSALLTVPLRAPARCYIAPFCTRNHARPSN